MDVKKLVGVALISINIGFTNLALAGSVATTSQTSAKLVASCEVGATNIDIGQIGAASGGYTAGHGTLTALCSNNAAYSLYAGDAYSTTTLKGASGTSIQYQLCSTSSTYISYKSKGLNCDGYIIEHGVSSISTRGTGLSQSFDFNAGVANGYYTPGGYSDTNSVLIVF
ncbi:Csu type fimbrial protein [Burkholderia cepacia]|uniref:hypothetical protein n=1 Tax=Burkholderia cepacia TaxID=292 RepID=UPI001CF32786|nr:hypothetical protein [Burkholderia cepacia]MCA8354209.1 hypothetical protein [Burkholderia cepacia]